MKSYRNEDDGVEYLIVDNGDGEYRWEYRWYDTLISHGDWTSSMSVALMGGVSDAMSVLGGDSGREIGERMMDDLRRGGRTRTGKFHPSVYLIIISTTMIMVGATMIFGLDLIGAGVLLRLAGNVVMCVGIVWIIVEWGRKL